MSLTTLEVTETKVSCHRPIGFRIGIGFLGLLFGVMDIYLFYAFWPSSSVLANRSPADLLSQSVYFLLVPLAGLCGPTAIFLYSAGPADLVVDASRRTYRFRRGFPLLASWQSGPLGDVAGLRVKTIKNKSTTSYQMMLDWRNTYATPWTMGDGTVSNRSPFQLLVSQDAICVHDEAERLASRLGLPLSENTPVWDDIRRRTTSSLVMVPIFFFFVLVGLPPLILAHSLEIEGQSAQGTVTTLRTGKGSFVHYTYPVGARMFTGRASVPGTLYSSLEVGGPVSVQYLPAYPHTSTVVGARGADISGPSLLMAGIILVIFLTIGRTPRT